MDNIDDCNAVYVDDCGTFEYGNGELVAIKEAEDSELLYLTVKSEKEAYDMYNKYAFSKGFGIRRGKNRQRACGDGWTMRRYLCSKAGLKDDSKKRTRCYDKIDMRTDCKAFLQFQIGKDGVWTCVRHEMVHNHEMVPLEKRHLLRSQRNVNNEQLHFMSTLKSSGVQVADAIRVMRKEAGGSPMVGFTQRDAYNALAAEKEKQLDGCDCKQLIRIFAQRMLVKYECSSNVWLNNLYLIKEKWCPAFSKDYFSGGVLSSQRSESTNHSLSHRLKATHGLCDFYNVFVDVVSEWRSRENGEDFNCLRGNRHLAFANVSILLHGREVYTSEVYKIFEEEFVKGTACDQENVGGSFPEFIYYVWRPKVDLIKHQRWCKSAMSSQSVEELRDRSKVVQSSVWRAQTLRFLVHFVTACQDIPLCRDEFEHGLKLLKEKVESIRGPINFSKGGEDKPKGAVEKACNKAKAWRKRVGIYSDELKARAQSSVQVFDQGVVGFVHPMAENSGLVRLLGDGECSGVQKKCLPVRKSQGVKEGQSSKNQNSK
ncbi:Protein FAR1-RELATED SEQUENCE 5, partial [Bienertia sinuspersici]